MSDKKLPDEVSSCQQKLDAYARTVGKRYNKREVSRAKRNESIDLSRHDREEESHEEFILAKETVARLLPLLTQRQMEVIGFLYFQDKNYKEVAEQCGIMVSTVLSHEESALIRMRKYLGVPPPPAKIVPKPKKRTKK